jgi:hypothetical protein
MEAILRFELAMWRLQRDGFVGHYAPADTDDRTPLGAALPPLAGGPRTGPGRVTEAPGGVTHPDPPPPGRPA